jgi:hypothetical protein
MPTGPKGASERRAPERTALKVETDDASFFHGFPLRSVGCDKHRRLGTLRCRQEGASTPSVRGGPMTSAAKFLGEQRPELAFRATRIPQHGSGRRLSAVQPVAIT